MTIFDVVAAIVLADGFMAVSKAIASAVVKYLTKGVL